ncbi:MAG: hypothetical protein J7500_01495 [Sphingomonas sp.]|uniref:hypothetical protein n=1 Tax=Sphingomonas sp. TaxID=28214 RepID=UPI001B2B2906|nr:hypothetical protein [Sphingomonas sp.]MBO9621363.1 hypothetical protein [Sphingomonas sp.]
MGWKRALRLGTMGGAMALSACTMADYGDGGYGPALYDPVPPPAYTAQETPDAYAYIDRADSLWEAIGDAPPDHSFAFEGGEPWAWQTEAGFRVIVEDGPEGIRSYYFEPGEAGPFLAVEPGHSYGYEGDAVAVVYGPDGGALPRAEGEAFLDEAMALYARARRIGAAMAGGQWEPIDTDAWADASPLIFSGFIQLWDEGRQRYPGWRSHRQRTHDQEWRRRLEAEQLRRRGLADAFRRWRSGGFQGPPPQGHWRKPGEHRPGTGRPHRPGVPPAAGTPQPPRPGVGRPDRPRPGAGWPRRPDVSPNPDASSPQQPGAGRPVRPNWPRRPDRRPEPSADPAAGTPQTPATRPAGAPGGWRPRPRPDATPGTAPAPRPQGAPDSGWRRGRPDPGNTGGGWRRPERPAPAPGAGPQPRPSYSPPPRPEPRSAPPPRSEPRAPSPRSSSPRSSKAPDSDPN